MKMKQIKHTPGPWKIDNHISVVANTSNRPIAITYPHTHLSSVESLNTMKANACLIATAPELLEMCKEFVFLEKTNMTKKQTQLRIDMAKDVIAKAEGN